jgi:hypothetical protein
MSDEEFNEREPFALEAVQLGLGRCKILRRASSAHRQKSEKASQTNPQTQKKRRTISPPSKTKLNVSASAT